MEYCFHSVVIFKTCITSTFSTINTERPDIELRPVSYRRLGQRNVSHYSVFIVYTA